MTANHITCTACGEEVRRGEAVIRGDLREQRGYHTECFTVTRALSSIDFAALEDMPLTRRLIEARLRVQA